MPVLDKCFRNLQGVPDFLPMSMEELWSLGRDYVDFVYITGDAYVDHPSFGVAILGKLLWAQGYTVGVVAQPQKDADYQKLGSPALGFLVSSGNVDSMVNNYSVAKRKRDQDFYSPGGRGGLRPDHAVNVYCQRLRKIYGADIPIIIGGIEAGLRRLAHYDYWSGNMRASSLIESGADILSYGMGERSISAIAALLAKGVPANMIRDIDGILWKTDDMSGLDKYVELPSFAEVKASKQAYAESFRIQYLNTEYQTAKVLVENYGNSYVVQNRPARVLDTDELDVLYGLHFARAPHPSYTEPIPSISEVKFSITSNRGCFGECNFCALTFNQGRQVTARSTKSMVAECEEITQLSDFKGYIHDVGGPTANFQRAACQKQLKHGACTHKQCLLPRCPSLEVSHKEYLNSLRAVRAVKGVKKVFIRSGIRYDYLVYDEDPQFFNELCKHHVSGQLKVAPEHVSSKVLRLMGKPDKDLYDSFVKQFYQVNERLGKKQYLVPYLMSSHPGSGLEEAIELAEYLRDNHISPQQVQDFYPTPGTVSTCMYYTGVNPLTMEKVYVARTPHEKAMQRALIQYRLPQNYELVREALYKAGRSDLIGFGPQCLIRPRKMAAEKQQKRQTEKTKQRKVSGNKRNKRY